MFIVLACCHYGCLGDETVEAHFFGIFPTREEAENEVSVIQEDIDNDDENDEDEDWEFFVVDAENDGGLVFSRNCWV